MAKPGNLLNAQEFAKNAGVSAATVSKWLRQGTIEGKKINGKWSVSSAELDKVNRSKKNSKPSTSTARQPKTKLPEAKPAAKSFSIQEFCDMTYLTMFGVEKWLKEGRLTKVTDAHGQVRVDALSLENPYVKRMLR